MLFRWIPVPGTTTPEPAPVDTVSEAALPSASTTEIWVVRDGSTGSGMIGGRSSMRRAAASKPGFVVEPPREAAAVELAGEARPARKRLLAHDADQAGDRVGAPLRAAEAGAVEQEEGVGDQHAAGGRRRIRDESVPEELGGDRPAPDHAVAAEVVPRQRAAARTDAARDAFSQHAVVEGLGTPFGEDLHRRGEVVHRQAVAGLQALAAGP